MHSAAIVGLMALAAVGQTALAQCPSDWSTELGDAVGQVHDAVLHDDGTGAALYVGGTFHQLGGQAIRTVGKRVGNAWSPLLPGLGSPCGLQRGSVYALASFGGELYAAGEFAQLYRGPGNGNCNPDENEVMPSIARWNGAQWRSLGGAGPGTVLVPSNGFGVYTLHVHDDGAGPQLYVGGQFTHVASDWTPGLARWDGTSWNTINGANDPNGRVTAMATFDADGAGPNPPHLYVAGIFETWQGMTVGGLVRWDGQSWSQVPGWNTQVARNYIPSVRSICVFDDDGAGPNPARLFVGGHLHNPDNETGNTNVTAWDGVNWTFPVAIPFGIGSGAYVTAMAAGHEGGEDVLYLGTEHWSFQGYAGFMQGWPHSIVRFDGQTTSTVGGGIWGPLPDECCDFPIFAAVTTMAEVPTATGPGLLVGGQFTHLEGGATTARNLVLWRTPSPRADFNVSGSVTVQDIFDFLAAYFAGLPTADFNGAGGVTVQDIFDFLATYFTGC